MAPGLPPETCDVANWRTSFSPVPPLTSFRHWKNGEPPIPHSLPSTGKSNSRRSSNARIRVSTPSSETPRSRARTRWRRRTYQATHTGSRRFTPKATATLTSLPTSSAAPSSSFAGAEHSAWSPLLPSPKETPAQRVCGGSARTVGRSTVLPATSSGPDAPQSSSVSFTYAAATFSAQSDWTIGS